MDKADLAFSTVESYLATEQFSFMWPILAVILAASLANAIAVNDSDKGTFEFVLAQPISRIRLYFSRYFSGLLLLASFVGVSIYAVVPLFNIHNIEYNITKFNTVALVSLAFITAIYSLAALFSVTFSEKGKAGFAVGGVVFLMYVLNILSTLKDSLVNLKYASFFYYYSPAQALNKGIIGDYSLIVLFGFAAVAALAGAFIFNKKDLT